MSWFLRLWVYRKHKVMIPFDRQAVNIRRDAQRRRWVYRKEIYCRVLRYIGKSAIGRDVEYLDCGLLASFRARTLLWRLKRLGLSALRNYCLNSYNARSVSRLAGLDRQQMRRALNRGLVVGAYSYSW